MTRKQKILDALKKGPMTSKAIAEKLGSQIYLVSPTLSALSHENKVHVIGEVIRDRRPYNLYSLEQPIKESVIKFLRVNRPYSDNEMHYGREGQKYSWAEIESEAKKSGYKPGLKLNKLPLYRV